MFDMIKTKVYKSLTKFFIEDKGAETMEYVAIAAVVIILGVAGYQAGGIPGLITTGITAIQNAITGVG